MRSSAAEWNFRPNHQHHKTDDAIQQVPGTVVLLRNLLKPCADLRRCVGAGEQYWNVGKSRLAALSGVNPTRTLPNVRLADTSPPDVFPTRLDTTPGVGWIGLGLPSGRKSKPQAAIVLGQVAAFCERAEKRRSSRLTPTLDLCHHLPHPRGLTRRKHEVWPLPKWPKHTGALSETQTATLIHVNLMWGYALVDLCELGLQVISHSLTFGWHPI